MKGIKYEWRDSIERRGPPILLEAPDRQYNFRSLYGYAPNTINIIQKNKHTRGLKGISCYSDLLIIDCDTLDDMALTNDRLAELGIAYEVWSTGNRGLHFHIDIEPMFGPNTIWSQIIWLQENNLWEIVDRSIYREGGQIRVPGAIHRKTNKPKELVKEIPGELLIVKERVRPPVSQSSSEIEEGTPEAIYEYMKNLMYRRGEGARHTHLFVLWKRGIAAGVDPDTLREDLRWWNDHFAFPPHTYSAIESKLRGFK